MNRTKIEWCDYYKGWLEAFIDSEGSLSIIKEKRPHFVAGVTFKPILSISNRCVPMLEQAKILIGGGAITKHDRKGCYQFSTTANILRGLLPKITLIAKEKQRLILIECLSILDRHAGKNMPRTTDELNHLQSLFSAIRKENGRWVL